MQRRDPKRYASVSKSPLISSHFTIMSQIVVISEAPVLSVVAQNWQSNLIHFN
jgi:hypothetical protein